MCYKLSYRVRETAMGQIDTDTDFAEFTIVQGTI